jgi:PBP1b-binding outer membrane lipoprotein LpoB
MKKMALIATALLAVMFFAGCGTTMYQLKYPAGKIVTMAPWTAAQSTKPTSQVLFTQTMFGSASNEDLTAALDECIKQADGTAINDMQIRTGKAFLGLLSVIIITGEVSK